MNQVQNVFNPDPNGGVAVAMVISIATGELITVEDEAYDGPGDPLAKLAGGTMEPGETKQQAVIREVSEETGIPKEDLQIFEIPGQLPVRVLAKNKKHYFHGFVVLATNFDKVHKNVRWDGGALLRVDIHKDADAVMRKPMVPQHRVLFTTMLNMVQG